VAECEPMPRVRAATAPSTPTPGVASPPPPSSAPRRRGIENKHSVEIGARLTLDVNAHVDALRRVRRFNVGGVVVLNCPREEEENEEEEKEEEEEEGEVI